MVVEPSAADHFTLRAAALSQSSGGFLSGLTAFRVQSRPNTGQSAAPLRAAGSATANETVNKDKSLATLTSGKEMGIGFVRASGMAEAGDEYPAPGRAHKSRTHGMSRSGARRAAAGVNALDEGHAVVGPRVVFGVRAAPLVGPEGG